MKKRHKHGHLKRRILDYFSSNPQLTSREIAERFGVHPAYVRKTLSRADLNTGFKPYHTWRRDGL